MTAVTLPDGGTIEYSYDEYLRLTGVTYPDQTTRGYAYGVPAHPWLLTSITDETGAIYATYEYDQNGVVISESHAGGVEQYSFTYNQSSTAVTDPLGQRRITATPLLGAS